MYIHRKGSILRNWLMQLWRLASLKPAGWTKGRGWRPREELMLQFMTKNHLLENSLLLGVGQSFALFRLSTYWVRPTYIMESNLLYSKSAYLNLILSKNTIRETSRIMFSPISGNRGPDKNSSTSIFFVPHGQNLTCSIYNYCSTS